MDAFANLGISLSGILFYLVNFGILIAILWKLLYRPLMDFTEKRRTQIQTNLNEAEKIRRDFEAKFKKKDEETDAKLRAMEAEIVEAKKSAEKKSAEIIEEAEARRLKMIQDARVIIGQMKEDIHKDIEKDVLDRIQKVVSTILREHVPAEVIQKSIQEEWHNLKKS